MRGTRAALVRQTTFIPEGERGGFASLGADLRSLHGGVSR